MYEESWLHRFEIKPGKWVFHPTEIAKEYGADVLDLLRDKFVAPHNYWHLKKGGHVGALRSHKHNRYFVKLDIADFFGSINKSRVTRVLRPILGYEKAREIASKSTVTHPTDGKKILPYGFKQSMMLASLALSQSALGRYLVFLEKTSGYIVSVYVDDIIISGNDLSGLSKHFLILQERANRSKFSLNQDKTQAPSTKVTAFNVNLEFNSLTITDERFSQFLIAVASSSSVFEKTGIKNYVKSISYTQWRQFP